MSEAIPLESVEISSAVPDGSGALTWSVADARAIQLHSAEKNTPETSGIVTEEKIFLVFMTSVFGYHICRNRNG